ncbi:MAG TPA: V-type ATP synthase subunit B, partial [Methanomethylovorans sp.]|nr:V-type ATP synthase subunit B [Methanomethylovorans sp.]
GLVAIVGKEALSERDQRILEFADLFEDRFVRQGREEDRSIEDTLNVAWSILSELPEALLTRVDNKFIEKYHPAHKKSN